jgi:4'-phosphopantetheinyl transferase EntD
MNKAASIVEVFTALAPAGAVMAVEAVRRPGGPHADHLAGRRAAARALAILGVAERPTGIRGSRPNWPVGTVGSISHAAGWAAAVAAHVSVWIALGVDVERSGALPAADAEAVCNHAERSVLAEFEVGHARDRSATLMWATKEAAFKAWDTWSGGQLYGIDPSCLDVRCGADGSAVAVPTCGSDLETLHLPGLRGRWTEAEGVVAVVLAARASHDDTPRDATSP